MFNFKLAIMWTYLKKPKVYTHSCHGLGWISDGITVKIGRNQRTGC